MNTQTDDPSYEQYLDLRSTLPHLVRARYSPYKFVGIIGGLGTGKSVVGAQRVIDMILDHPGGHGLCAGLTFSGHALTLMKPYIEEELQGCVSFNFKSLTGQMAVRLPGLPETLIDFAGMQNSGDYKRIMYQSYDWIWADELTHFNKENWDWLKRRLRGKVGPRKAWFTSIPDGPDHWLLQEISQLGLKVGENLFYCTSYDNKTLPSDYIDLLEQTHVGGAYRRLVLGEWAALEGEMFTRVPEQVDMPPRDKLKVSIGIDPAYSTRTEADYFAVCVVGEDIHGNYYLLDAYMKKGLEFGIAVDTIANYCDTWRPGYATLEGHADNYLYRTAQKKVSNLVSVSPTADKVSRALPLIHAWNAGQIKCAIPVGNLRSQIIAQIMQFPTGDHDDIVDAFAYAFNSLTGQVGKAKYKPSILKNHRLS